MARIGTVLKLTAFRFSPQTMSRLDELVFEAGRPSALFPALVKGSRTDVIRSLINDAYAKLAEPVPEIPKEKKVQKQKKIANKKSTTKKAKV